MSAHAAADTDDNALRNWTPLPASPDADLLAELPTIVGRTRDLTRNNGVAQGGANTLVDHVVGTGLRLSSRPMHKLLGRDKDWAREFACTVEGFHRLWWESTDCDACDELDGAGLCAQAILSLWNNGEACAIPMWLPEPGKLFNTRLLLIEPDQLSNPNCQPDTDRLRAGVQRNAYGRPEGYWVRSTHPGDRFGFGLSTGGMAGEWTYIPARTAWGRSRFLHLHDKDRTGVTRGKPLLAAVMKPFKQLDHYLSVHLQTAIVQSLVAAFITTAVDQETLVEMFGGDADAARRYFDAKAAHDSRIKLKGGALIPLNPGDTVTPFAPPNANNGVDQFVMTMYRVICAATGMPYELLVKDFTKTTYTSARAAMLEFYRFVLRMRHKLGRMFCQPGYELVLEEMVDRGMVQAPDYYVLHRAYAASKWIGGGRGWVDGVKEATAASMRMDANLSTLEDENAEQGRDWEEVMEQRAIEMQRKAQLEAEYGVTFPDHQPATVAAAGAPVAPEPDPNDRGPGKEPEDGSEPAGPTEDAPQGTK